MAKRTSKKEIRKITTPKVQAKWIYLAEPNDKFNEGVYEITLLFDPDNPDHAAFIQELEEIEQELKNQILKDVPATRKKSLIHYPLLKEDLDVEGNETGYLKLRAKSKRAPLVFDAKLNQIPAPTNAGTGTVVRASITLSPYLAGKNVGVTCYLNAVQIIELVEYAAGPEKFGFEPEEGYSQVEVIDFSEEDNDVNEEAPF